MVATSAATQPYLSRATSPPTSTAFYQTQQDLPTASPDEKQGKIPRRPLHLRQWRALLLITLILLHALNNCSNTSNLITQCAAPPWPPPWVTNTKQTTAFAYSKSSYTQSPLGLDSEAAANTTTYDAEKFSLEGHQDQCPTEKFSCFNLGRLLPSSMDGKESIAVEFSQPFNFGILKTTGSEANLEPQMDRATHPFILSQNTLFLSSYPSFVFLSALCFTNMTTRPSRKSPSSSSLLAATKASTSRTRSSSRLKTKLSTSKSNQADTAKKDTQPPVHAGNGTSPPGGCDLSLIHI